MGYKFEKLEVWSLALEYVDLIYHLAENLPISEEYNLKSQIRRAATSIALNIAEGSTSQTDAEQVRFINMAIRSLVETVACQHLINRRKYLKDPEALRLAYQKSEALFAKLQAFRASLKGYNVREDSAEYFVDEDTPF
jgi:four helix bundle protein